MKTGNETRHQQMNLSDVGKERTNLSFRVCLLALGFAVISSVFIPYFDLTTPQAWLGITALPIASFASLFVLVVIFNPLFRLFRFPLSQQELLACFVAVMVVSGIASLGLTGLLLQYLVGPHYYATAENRWDELLLPHIPRWLHPESKEVVRYFYEGLPKGVSPLPFLSAWVRPLSACLPLVVGVYLTLFALTSLLWRQWVENEKLVFPLVALPMEMTNYESSSDWFPSFFRNKTMWAWFAFPFSIHTINGLHAYFPQVPFINVQRRNLDPYLPGKPWDAIAPFWITLPFSVIGFAYLLPTEITGSIVFFYAFFLTQQIIASAMGRPLQNIQAYPVKDFVAHQMFGGILMFGLYLLWNARAQLVRSKARSEAECRQNSLSLEGSPQTFFILLLLGVLLISVWSWFGGAGIALTLALFGLFFLTHLVAVRLVCEGGLLLVQHPLRPWNFLLTLFGSERFTSRQIVLLTFFDHLFMLDNRAPLMPCLMQGMKIAHASATPVRPLTNLMALSVAFSLPISAASFLLTAYRRGGVNLHPWFTTYFARNLYGNWTEHLLTFGQPPSPKALLQIGIGVATMVVLIFLHRTIPTFPLHPIGYLTGASFPAIAFWFPILLGWFFKAMTVKFGGTRLYRRLMPGFLGWVMAEYLSASLWTAINAMTGRSGPEIFVF